MEVGANYQNLSWGQVSICLRQQLEPPQTKVIINQIVKQAFGQKIFASIQWKWMQQKEDKVRNKVVYFSERQYQEDKDPATQIGAKDHFKPQVIEDQDRAKEIKRRGVDQVKRRKHISIIEGKRVITLFKIHILNV